MSLSDKDIINRIITRRICPNPDCREVYNLEFKKPKKDGICDKCGRKLIQRDDDKEETIKNRLEEYKSTSQKLVNYYKQRDLLYSVKLNLHSKKTSEDVAKEVEEKFIKRDS